jgi:hypothetical protein
MPPNPNFAPGEMAERSIAAVLKTVEGQTSGGSNPSLSADIYLKPAITAGFVVFKISCVQYRVQVNFTLRNILTCMYETG